MKLDLGKLIRRTKNKGILNVVTMSGTCNYLFIRSSIIMNDLRLLIILHL